MILSAGWGMIGSAASHIISLHRRLSRPKPYPLSSSFRAGGRAEPGPRSRTAFAPTPLTVPGPCERGSCPRAGMQMYGAGVSS